MKSTPDEDSAVSAVGPLARMLASHESAMRGVLRELTALADITSRVSRDVVRLRHRIEELEAKK